MKKIMFLYHVKEREYEIIELIEHQIKEIDFNVEIRIGEFYSSILDTIHFKPDIIVSMPPRDVHASNYLTALKIFTKAVVISMSTEGEYRFIPQMIQNAIGLNTYAKELVDYYIMWGPKTKGIFGKYLLKDSKLADMGRIKVSGYAYYEIDKVKEKYKKHDMYQIMKEWFSKHEKNLLVLTGFFFADINLQEYQILGYFGDTVPLNKRTPAEINTAKATIAADDEFRKKYVDMIIALSQNYPDMGIVVKLHPVEISEKVKYYDKLLRYSNILLVKEAVPVGIMLESVDAMIHYNSTCNSEAYIYKVPTIQIYSNSDQTLCKEVQWNIKSNSAYLVNIDDFKALDNLMRDKIEYKELHLVEKRLYELFNWRKEREYNAIEKNAYYIYNAKKPQHLKYRDQEVIKAIQSKEGQKIINILICDIIKNISDNKRIWKDICALFRICKYSIVDDIFAVLDKQQC